MSTNPWRAKAVASLPAVFAALVLTACAGPAPEPGHSFSEVRLHRVAPPPAPAYLAAAAPDASADATSPAIADRASAEKRVRALLTEDGFTIETARDGGVQRLTATRMSGPAALRDEAVCPLKAMHRPDFSATDLDVRLGAPGGGVTVAGRFVLVDTNLISGDLTRQRCRSNGALEAAVRRAAAG